MESLDDDCIQPQEETISSKIIQEAESSTVNYRSTSLKDFLEDNSIIY